MGTGSASEGVERDEGGSVQRVQGLVTSPTVSDFLTRRRESSQSPTRFDGHVRNPPSLERLRLIPGSGQEGAPSTVYGETPCLHTVLRAYLKFPFR